MRQRRSAMRTLAGLALVVLGGCMAGEAGRLGRWSSTRPWTASSPSRSSTLTPSGPASRSCPSSTSRAPRRVGLTQPDHRRGGAPAVRPVLEQRDPQHAAAQGEGAARAVHPRRRPSDPGDLQGRGRHLVRLRRPGADPDRQHRARARGRPARRGSTTWSTRSGRARSASPSRCSARPPRTPPACSRPGATRRPRRFFRDLKANDVQVLSGNKQVAQAVALGPARLRPDRHRRRDGEIEQRGGPGGDRLSRTAGRTSSARCSSPTRWPSSRGRRTPRRPRRWPSYLLSPEVEATLADGPSAQIPLLEGQGLGPGRDAQDRPCDGGRLRGGGQALGPGRRLPRRAIRRLSRRAAPRRSPRVCNSGRRVKHEVLWANFRGQGLEERPEVDVAPGEDEPDPQAAHRQAAGQDRGDGDGPGGLDDDLEPLPDEPHGGEDLGLGGGDDRVDVPLDHREGARAERGAQAVGDRPGVARGEDRAGLAASGRRRRPPSARRRRPGSSAIVP